MTDYGVEYRGRRSTFITGGYTLAGATEQLAHAAGADPKPVRIMRRECSSWEPVEDGKVST